jgi:hypothetical protein
MPNNPSKITKTTEEAAWHPLSSRRRAERPKKGLWIKN